MKSFIKPAVLFTALAMVFVLASCEAETKTDNPVMYTVIFDGNGSEPAFTDKVSVKSGEGLLIPKIKLIKTGYDFAGWYIGDVEVDADTKITKDTTVTAHWTLHEYSITYAGLEDAENPNTVTTYTIESEEIPLLDATKNGCTFGGWKNGDEFVTEIAKGTTGDITLTALWEIIPVTDVILNNTELTLITGDTETLTATVLPENPFDKTVTWTSSNKNVATVTNGVVTAVAKGNATITASVEEQSAMCTVTVENSITMLPAGTDGTAGTDGVYLLFGRWPQTVKTADVTIKNETKRAGMFTYYKGSDGEWYVKVVENPISSAYTYSDGTAVGWGGTSEKYFKVEPIKWRILTDNYSGKKLLLAENILVNCAYYDNTSTRTINGNNVYVNNYEHSRVRAYLNGLSYNKDGGSNKEFYGKGFLQTAFNSREIKQIAVITVDNGKISTTDSNYSFQTAITYTCNNTEDRIFLLSEQEVTTASYGFPRYVVAGKGCTRIRITTDFAKASGTYQYSKEFGGGNWWLRSPYYDFAVGVRNIDINGKADNYLFADHNSNGVVPALCLN